MGIWDRLGRVLKSHLDSDSSVKGRDRTTRHADPDIDAAYEELNEFLNKDKAKPGEEKDKWDFTQDKTSGSNTQQTMPPEELRRDFAELGLPFGASAETCKEAYKKLLKIHHPDRHAGHQGNFKKATEKSARINAAYDRITQWAASMK